MSTHRIVGFTGTMLFMLCATALAGDKAALIELDKQWGNASLAGDADAVAALMADDLVAMNATGVGGKQRELANLENAPEGATYTPTDYMVTFLDDDTAVMTHGVSGENAHYSLHVWSKQSGSWQVVATASAAAESE